MRSAQRLSKLTPIPRTRSRTFSPRFEEYSMARVASSTGFSVKWTDCCELTFLTPRGRWHCWGRSNGGLHLRATRSSRPQNTNVVLAGQDRMLFVPNDAIARSTGRRLFRTRAGSWRHSSILPRCKMHARNHHASNVPEPRTQHLVECFVRNEVVGQRTVLGPELASRGLGLLGMALDVELLMV